MLGGPLGPLLEAGLNKELQHRYKAILKVEGFVVKDLSKKDAVFQARFSTVSGTKSKQKGMLFDKKEDSLTKN